MHLTNLKTVIVLAIGLGVCIVGLLYVNYRSDTDEVFKTNLTDDVTESEVSTEASTEDTTIVVYITGEVKKPDVYSLAAEARLVDLIDKAGGFTDKAYIDDLNLAQVLNDGEKYVVQNVDNVSENETENESDNAVTDEEEGLVNINTADLAELDSLPGVGEKIAENIIAYRDKWGSFDSIEEIKEVEGIGDGIYDRIKDSITID